MDKSLRYYLKNIYQMTLIPASYVDSSEGRVLFSIGFAANQNPLKTDSVLTKQLVQKVTNKERPILEFEDDIFLYGLFEDISGVIVLGPVVIGEITNSQRAKFAKRHKLLPESIRIKSSNLSQLTATLANVFFVQSGQMLTGADIALEHGFDMNHTSLSASLQTYMMDNIENDVLRLRYIDEKEVIQKIKEGDTESILAIRKMANTTDYISMMEMCMGCLAANKFKHFEYMTCAAITLFSRAAIEGGMDVSSAYALSDLFFQRLEKCKTITDMIDLCYEAQLKYTSEVRKILDKRNHSSYVEKAKSFIVNHLNKAFNLEDVAEAVGVSRSYLAQLFSKEEGISVMEYTRNKRIEAAANMLRYSDESISAIAAYLCFHSQSHFGATFKKIMGVTPRRYREMHSLIDVQRDKAVYI